MKRIAHRIWLACVLTVCGMAASTQPLYNLWLGSVNDFKINSRFSFHLDIHIRSADAVRKVQTTVVRPGLTFKLTNSITVATGYAYFRNRRTVNFVSNLLPENRMWQQVVFQHKLNKISFTHRFKFEERWLARPKILNNKLETDGYNQAFRLRYLAKGLIPFSHTLSFEKGFFLNLQDEVFINTGDKIAVNGKGFDQNRAYAGIGYRLNNKMDLEANYLNQYTITSNSFINNHIAQIVIYKRL